MEFLHSVGTTNVQSKLLARKQKNKTQQMKNIITKVKVIIKTNRKQG